LRRALAKLDDALSRGDLARATAVCYSCDRFLFEYLSECDGRKGYFLDSIKGRDQLFVGPLVLGGLEFHGFVPGCSPGTLLVSLRKAGWPLALPLWEHDVKAAFDTANLGILFHSIPNELLGVPFTLKLARSVMGSGLVVRRALLEESVTHHPEWAVTAAKQFPNLSPGVVTFGPQALIQGSPLSPILFILFLASASLVEKVQRGESAVPGINHGNNPAPVYWIYGDNVYSRESIPPNWSHCHWKAAVPLGVDGKTLGLTYKLDGARLVVYYPEWIPYQKGVQRKLDAALSDRD
jgi:hypothetical protein